MLWTSSLSCCRAKRYFPGLERCTLIPLPAPSYSLPHRGSQLIILTPGHLGMVVRSLSLLGVYSLYCFLVLVRRKSWRRTARTKRRAPGQRPESSHNSYQDKRKFLERDCPSEKQKERTFVGKGEGQVGERKEKFTALYSRP